MINCTQIRKIFKLSCYDPKPIGTEWHIDSRDMTHMAHVLRAKQLLNYYTEGVHDAEIIHKIIWHLAVAMVKYYQEMRKNP